MQLMALIVSRYSNFFKRKFYNPINALFDRLARNYSNLLDCIFMKHSEYLIVNENNLSHLKVNFHITIK